MLLSDGGRDKCGTDTSLLVGFLTLHQDTTLNKTYLRGASNEALGLLVYSM